MCSVHGFCTPTSVDYYETCTYVGGSATVEVECVETVERIKPRTVKARGRAALMAESFKRRTVRKLTWV